MNVLLQRMGRHNEINIMGYKYYKGRIDGCPVIIARTRMGEVNCAVSTLLALQRFRPLAVIDQGTSGGHDKTLTVGDIVLCESAIFGDAVKTGTPDTILPIEAVSCAGVKNIIAFQSDAHLLQIARSIGECFEGKRVVTGRTCTTHKWNTKPEDISALHALHSSSVEEMEAAAGAQVCYTFGVPYLTIRILSNSDADDIAGDGYDLKVGEICQRFVIEVIKRIYEKK